MKREIFQINAWAVGSKVEFDSDQDCEASIRTRLIQAALDCFLSDDYHNVSTRQIAEKAGANVSMIRYYFGSKQGLYEEMIRDILQPLLNAVDGKVLNSVDGFSELFALHYATTAKHPEFPRLLLKVLGLNQGPGRRFMLQLLARGQNRGNQHVAEMQANGQIDPALDPELIRIAFISLALLPVLMKDVFELEMGRSIDNEFFKKMAAFHGHLFSAGLPPTAQ